VSLVALDAQAKIDGLTGTTFNVTAKANVIGTPDGGSFTFWGYAPNDGIAQYPGPTLIVNQGDTITINLTNRLAVPVSMIFPGQTGVTATGGVPGLLTREAPADNALTTVTYTFTASKAGTYGYSSGTNPALQLEMGLVGAIIVRPYGFDPANPRAYAHVGSGYTREFLFLLTEIDPKVHAAVDRGNLSPDTSNFFPVYWFINGRNAPDTMLDAFLPWMPTQPYNCMPVMHPGDKVLMRVVNAGRDLHPFHFHGNHARIIAHNGRLLESIPGVSGPDLGTTVFTYQTVPGETLDGIFEWTGENLGWDIYGHKPGDPLEPNEFAGDHGKPFPVILPDSLSLTFGEGYSGSPFLGAQGSLPPGQGEQNRNGGYFYMWHSHTEKEMTNWDIFPGGMMTMLVIEAPDVDIMD